MIHPRYSIEAGVLAGLNEGDLKGCEVSIEMESIVRISELCSRIVS